MTESHDIDESGNICANCHEKVFFNERAPPFLTRIYHARCFKCNSCNKILYAGGFMDHGEDPFCECCYERLFAGNRKMYSSALNKTIGEIDKSDPLKEIKSSTKTGKLDIKRFSIKHNIPQKIKQSQSKSYKHNAKLHRYMIGNTNDTLMLEGRMKFIHNKLQNRLHKMIIHKCYTLQQQLIESVDDILEKEILHFDHNRVSSNNKKTLFDPKSFESNQKNAVKNEKEFTEMRNTLETHIDVADIADVVDIKGSAAKTQLQQTRDIIDDTESDLDTHELIARLTTNKPF